jgi:hypothetical protein
MLKKQDGMVWYGLDASGLGWGPVEGCCERGNETSGSKKCTNFWSGSSTKVQLCGASESVTNTICRSKSNMRQVFQLIVHVVLEQNITTAL